MHYRALSLPSVFLLGFLILGSLAWPGAAQAQVSSPGPYVSEMRDTCIAEMKKDAKIQVACMTEYSNEFHEQDARQATANKTHVIWAYGVLWGIVTVFVILLWLRQRKLSSEIARLEAELAKAAAE